MPAPNQAHLLAAVLGVVPGVGLVRDEMGERRRQHREVGVDRDHRAQSAQIGVEARPRLVRDELELDALALGEPEEQGGALAQVVGQRVDRRRQHLGRNGVRLAPGDETFPERPRTGERLLETPVRGGEVLVGDRSRAHPVARLHLLGVADGLSRQPARRSEQAHGLRPQPPSPRRARRRPRLAPRSGVGVEWRPAVEFRDQRPAVLDQSWRRRRRCERSALGQGRRPVVGVHQSLDMAPQGQPELEVPAQHSSRFVGGGSHPRRAWKKSMVRPHAAADAAAS